MLVNCMYSFSIILLIDLFNWFNVNGWIDFCCRVSTVFSNYNPSTWEKVGSWLIQTEAERRRREAGVKQWTEIRVRACTGCPIIIRTLFFAYKTKKKWCNFSVLRFSCSHHYQQYSDTLALAFRLQHLPAFIRNASLRPFQQFARRTDAVWRVIFVDLV